MKPLRGGSLPPGLGEGQLAGLEPSAEEGQVAGA